MQSIRKKKKSNILMGNSCCLAPTNPYKHVTKQPCKIFLKDASEEAWLWLKGCVSHDILARLPLRFYIIMKKKCSKTQRQEQRQIYCEINAFLFFLFLGRFFFKDVWNICGGFIAAIASKRPWITKVLE